MNEDYWRGYLDALHYSAGVALAFERMARNSSEAEACRELLAEIDAFIIECKTGHEKDRTTPDLHRANLLSLAPRLLESLKHVISTIEAGAEINPGLLREYQFVIHQAEGRDS